MSKVKSKIKDEWNLTQLYKSVDDPQIEKDIVDAEKAHNSFVKKYKKADLYLKDENALLKAVLDYEKLCKLPVSKIMFYLFLYQDIDSKNQNVRAKKNLLTQRLQKIDNLVNFFVINISKIPANDQKIFLSSKKLSSYRYMLEKSFESGKHTLTEKEENILSLKSLPSSSMWVDATKKVLNKQVIEYRGKKIPLANVNATITQLKSQKERLELHNKMMDLYESFGDTGESELNAVVTNKRINDDLRGFKEPYDATILGYENDRKTVLNLVDVVTKGFTLSKRFYKVKTKMLKIKNLYYSDRSVPVGKVDRKITFKESSEILLNLFNSIDPEFNNILSKYLENGQIDAYPKQGKTSGAYCADDNNAMTFVLLNHNDTMDSLSTYAHEMGHAIHTEFSKSQNIFYKRYSMSTAETASTLFEQFLFYSEFEKLSDKEKIVALHDKIQDDVQTIFRQIACFNFELEMHNTIREKGSMSKEELASTMNKHMRSYIGDVKLTPKDGYFFVGWPHLRYIFYVYSYAFGQLASKALYSKYQHNKNYITEIKKFLSLGGSMSPEDIFKSIGVDVTKPDFWKQGLKTIEDDIARLEKLVKKS